MNERERWIVYPLLFFALGAALRDKYTQRVETKDLQASRIICEELSIVDPEKPDRIVAKLASGAPQTPTSQPSDRFGVLLLIDSQGQELCGVTNNRLEVDQIACKGLVVIDPDNPRRLLAGLSSLAMAPTKSGGASQRIGVLALNNQEFGTLTGVPPKTRRAGQGQDEPPEVPPATAAESAEKQPPGDEE